MDSQENILQQEQAENVKQTEEVVNAEAQETVAPEVPEVETTAPETEATAEDVEPEAVAEEPVEEPAETVVEPEAEPEEVAEPVAEEPATDEEKPAEEAQAKTYESKADVLDRLKEIVSEGETPRKDELDMLKTIFYKFHIAEREAKLKEYLDAGGDPEKYQITPDEDENVFKAEMAVIKERRQKAFQQTEAEKQENLKKKLDIIEQIKAIATSPDEANKSYQTFKALQQQWREIKAVPAEKANELWRNYQLYVEQFYDLLKLNIEAREYDFKKNLEMKTKLCEAAEKLAEEPDVVSAFQQLQELHQQYREIGPVSKELREETWARFKAASTVVNKRHQQHFESLRAQEDENLAKKTALCEKVEAIAQEENKGAADWEKHTKQIIEIQNEWKTIGFAPQKMNVKIFERFRAACDSFFSRKAEYFKDMKQRFSENAEKKRALVEKAQALADSTEWRSTSDKLIALQKEWKSIGMVPKKLGDQLWNDFLAACNKFFEARNAANVDTRSTEHANLATKRSIIEQMKAILEDKAEDAEDKVQELIEQYQATGHVPFKEKDKIYAEYHEVVDKLRSEFNINTSRRKLDNFKNNIKNIARRGEDALDNERGRLMRKYEQMKQEIQTYENNLGFLNAASKKGNSLIDELNKKVQKLKDDCELVRQKIKAIDAENAEED
ncbi:MAG: DUF349 domain-containing protein [Prevotella sp.]|nr:DUF349 domain-containing protein [Prevotella sp.]